MKQWTRKTSMPEITITFSIAAFIAGVFMFLAPCTLPLIPAYLAFISGVTSTGSVSRSDKRQIVINALAFVVGFTLIFTSFGILAGFFGNTIGTFRGMLTQLGGGIIILFGLIMLNVIQLPVLARDHRLPLPGWIVPGNTRSAFLIGAVFALGWTPCIGPVLASVLLLATTSSSILSGGLLLFIFSLGLAVPMLLTAILYAHMSEYIMRYAALVQTINRIGGVMLVLLGSLLLIDQFDLLIQYGYPLFSWLELEGLYRFY